MTESRRSIRVGERSVGPEAPTFLVAEVGQAHEGSLGMAHAYIDAVAGAGADAVKFQVHLADAESTLDEPFRIRLSEQDATRLAYWRRMEFVVDDWIALAEHARARGLAFLVSGFSVAAVQMLPASTVDAWKIGSGEFASTELFTAMGRTGLPIVLSTGMSTYEEVDAAVATLEQLGAQVAVLHCTSSYPAALELVGLNNLELLRQRTSWPVGLSDHTGSIWPGIVAAAQGADIVEVHVIFDRRQYGADTAASLTIDELGTVADALQTIRVLTEHPTDKDAVAHEMDPMREIFGKSVAPARVLPAGHRLERADLALKKPGNGIGRSELSSLVGRRTRRALSPDRLLRWDDLVDEER